MSRHIAVYTALLLAWTDDWPLQPRCAAERCSRGPAGPDSTSVVQERVVDPATIRLMRMDARESESPIGLPEPSLWAASAKAAPRMVFPGLQRLEKRLELRQAGELIARGLRVLVARRQDRDAVTARDAAAHNLKVSGEIIPVKT
ncbi:hypothetical protein AB4Z40_25850 [Bosea sp. 2YAB26]|uniref:hypothetical protein n=1 Tax=Bosea sp. 2YAB26 TaxID=3237478 RepID=UPI003F920BC7